jgi:hypothetical protein
VWARGTPSCHVLDGARDGGASVGCTLTAVTSAAPHTCGLAGAPPAAAGGGVAMAAAGRACEALLLLCPGCGRGAQVGTQAPAAVGTCTRSARLAPSWWGFHVLRLTGGGQQAKYFVASGRYMPGKDRGMPACTHGGRIPSGVRHPHARHDPASLQLEGRRRRLPGGRRLPARLPAAAAGPGWVRGARTAHRTRQCQLLVASNHWATPLRPQRGLRAGLVQRPSTGCQPMRQRLTWRSSSGATAG